MKTFYWFIVNLVFGLWLIISPYALGFTGMAGAYWNAILVGLVFTLTSIVGLYLSYGEFAGSKMLHHAS